MSENRLTFGGFGFRRCGWRNLTPPTSDCAVSHDFERAHGTNLPIGDPHKTSWETAQSEFLRFQGRYLRWARGFANLGKGGVCGPLAGRVRKRELPSVDASAWTFVVSSWTVAPRAFFAAVAPLSLPAETWYRDNLTRHLGRRWPGWYLCCQRPETFVGRDPAPQRTRIDAAPLLTETRDPPWTGCGTLVGGDMAPRQT